VYADPEDARVVDLNSNVVAGSSMGGTQGGVSGAWCSETPFNVASITYTSHTLKH
jgi:hypothetical protein